MQNLVEHKLNCPYCGEPIAILVDGSIAQQEYIEDCQVCCRPIVFKISISADDELIIEAFHENE
ncbi:MAG: CPXCG motif-containing cysteine-rich protein [Gammaproteobacteria bacterium]|nr:CPXCG motif-containing cysteine-rich protein [Gammaproteobacteria bacterium]